MGKNPGDLQPTEQIMVGISKYMKIINLQIGELNKLTRNMI